MHLKLNCVYVLYHRGMSFSHLGTNPSGLGARVNTHCVGFCMRICNYTIYY